MVLIKGFAKLDRQAKWAGIRAYIYAKTGGDPVQAIEVTATLLPELGLSYAEFEPSFNYLDTQEQSIRSSAGMSARITNLGIEKVEEDVTAWIRGGRQSTPLAPIFEEAYAVTCEFEWQRFRFLLAMHELSGGQPGPYIFIEKLNEELGEVDVSAKTVSHLVHRRLIDRPLGMLFNLTDAGCVMIERMIGCLHRLGQSEYLDQAEFHGILPGLWEQLAHGAASRQYSGFSPSPDYSFVRTDTLEFKLPPRAARVIRILDMARKDGRGWVRKEEILDSLGGNYSKVREAFYPNHLDAYGALVEFDRRGNYRLKNC